MRISDWSADLCSSDLALAYSGRREQFGRPICEFQGLQWMLADMATQPAAARDLIHQAADCGAGFPDVLEAAQAKVFASETAVKVTKDALQIFGAAGDSRNTPRDPMVRDEIGRADEMDGVEQVG